MDLAALRQDYTKDALDRDMLDEHPQTQFSKWMQQAQDAQMLEPNAFAVATVDAQGQPFTRMVLLKHMDEKGLVFFTNYESRKAQHLAENNRISALFSWLPLERQVSINGTAEKIPTSESLKYFVTRPFASQLGAWASQQSTVISSRSILQAKLEEMKHKFSSGQVPIPSFWGGFRIKPTSWEFWQGGSGRIHDRFLYTTKEGGWEINRLSP